MNKVDETFFSYLVEYHFFVQTFRFIFPFIYYPMMIITGFFFIYYDFQLANCRNIYEALVQSFPIWPSKDLVSVGQKSTLFTGYCSLRRLGK